MLLFFFDLSQKSVAHTGILQKNQFCQDGWGITEK